jgi:peptidoglycan/xylan/chitin deacetylase (PgdA/CDA1 family)
MRKRVKALMGRALVETGLLRRMMGDAGLVVAFHRVNDDSADSLTCRVSDFEQYCRFFRRSFEPIPLSEFVDRMEHGRSVAGTLAITFDDGYRDNFDNAAPILKRFDLPATFFIASGFMSTDHVAWWDQDLEPAPPWMSWDELVELARMGFEIGAHTRTHVDLGRVKGEVAGAEIRGSKLDLESRLGIPVSLFAYPYGRMENFCEENREEVYKAGFRCCASCHGGLVRPGSDPLRMNRVPISDWFSSPEQLAFEVGLNRV